MKKEHGTYLWDIKFGIGVFIVICILGFVRIAFAEDKYYVEVDAVTKELKSDSILKDGDVLENISADRVLIELTQAEYEASAGEESEWEAKWNAWKKISKNDDKIVIAIATKPMSDAEVIADLKARLKTLEEASSLEATP